MAEFESLARHEGLSAHIARHQYDRLLMLSDGIFAIATTLAALEIQMPSANSDFSAMIGMLARPVLAYGLSFIFIALFWIQNRDLFGRLQRVDQPLTMLTLAMLCAIALVPAALRGVFEHGENSPSFRLYALQLFVCGLLNLSMWAYAALRSGLMHADVSRGFRWRRILLALVLPLVSGPLILLPPERAIVFVLGVAVVTMIGRRWLAQRFPQ